MKTLTKYIITFFTLLLLVGCEEKRIIQSNYDNPYFDVTKTGHHLVVMEEIKSSFRKAYPKPVLYGYSFEEQEDGIYVIYTWDDHVSVETFADKPSKTQNIKSGEFKTFIKNDRLQEIINF